MYEQLQVKIKILGERIQELEIEKRSKDRDGHNRATGQRQKVVHKLTSIM